MKTRTLITLGLVATGTLAALRAVPRLAGKRQEKVKYDAELSTWEGEGGSMGSTPPNKVGIEHAASHQPESMG